MPKFDFNGYPVFYQKNYDSTPSASPLLLVHGSTGNSYHWPAILRQHKYPILAIDLPGHGRSKGPSYADTFVYADVINALANAETLDNFFLAGHSLGGAVSLNYATRWPDRLLGLIMVSSGARLPVVAQVLKGTESEEGKAQVAEFISKVAYGREMTGAVRSAGLKAMLAVPAKVFHDDFTACSKHNLSSDLGALALPTLILCGSADKMTPVGLSEELARLIQGSRLQIVKGAGHMLPLEKPDFVTQQIIEFIQGNDVSTRP
jgi:pimeloyl-ACP methyl ester carboxylesterase